MRFHESLLCVAAMLAPLIAAAVFLTWVAPLVIFFAVSLPLIWLTGWLIDHSYS